MKKAIYSGTFDPITLGHIDIIKKSLGVFDKVVLAIATSTSKKPMFSLEQRIEFARLSTKGLDVEIKSFDSLMVDFCKSENIKHIIRGVRTNIDFEYELNMAYANNSIDDNIDTIFFTPELKNSYISSSIVREILKFGGDISHLVDSRVLKVLQK